MNLELLSVEEIIQIHDACILPKELQGMAANKSIESAIDRIPNKIAYGVIDDVFDLSACYAQAIAEAHAFNDANKRTAFFSMSLALKINNHFIPFKQLQIVEEAGAMIVKLVTKEISVEELAAWLRELYSKLQ